MNILFFIHSLSSGGAERVTTTLANYWAGKGWAITVVTVTGDESDFYALDDRVRRVSLNMAVNSHGPFEAFSNNARRVRALRKLLIQHKPDVAVAMMATSNVTLAIAGRLTGIVTFGSERTYPPAMPLGRFWELLRRRTYPWLNYLVAQTKESESWCALHAPAKNMAVIPNPVDFPMRSQPPVIKPDRVISKLNCRKVLLAVGRLGEEKRFGRLLSTFADLATRHPDWGLVILGKGALMNALLEQVTSLGIEERVALPGAVGNVGDWFNAADLYVLTSRFEGFPNTLVEALAHGLPSVAVDCQTGPREIMRHGIDGLLVPQDRPAELYTALDCLMSDQSLRDSFSKRAVEVRERYAVERIAGQWEELFQNLK